MAADRRPYESSTAPPTDPRPRITNPPGLSAIEYRVGTYATFLEDTLRHFATARVERRHGGGHEPLATLNLSGAHNFALGLAEAWAAVGDVLTFYQERIANEGFLRTATDHASISKMVRAIGYQPSAGLAANTYLAFTVYDARQAPRTVRVPQGTAVQSLPLSGGMPQIFETSSDLSARSAFNAVPASIAQTSVAQHVSSSTREITVKGGALAIRPGDRILMAGSAADGSGPVRWLRPVTSVTADTRKRVTRLGFDALADVVPPVTIAAPVLVRMRRTTRVFGANAAPWSKLPESTRRAAGTVVGPIHVSTDWGTAWSPVDDGLADAPIRCLAVSPDGNVFAGLAGKGVFRLPSGASKWVAASDGLTRQDVHALTFDDRGNIVAGTARGGVFRSTDGARTWEAVGSSAPRLRFEDGKIESIVTPGIPDTVVRSVAAFEHVSPEGHRFDRVWVGTDAGVFRTMEIGDAWEPISTGLPGTDEKTGVTGTSVRALLVAGAERFAATDSGVFRWFGKHEGWRDCSDGLPVDATRGTARVRSLCAVTRPDGHVLVLAATDSGLWALHQPFDAWRHSSVGLPDGVEVHTLSCTHGAIHERPIVAAATANGVYRSLDGGATWAELAKALAAPVFETGLGLAPSLDLGGFVTEPVQKAFRAHSLTLDATSTITVLTAGQSWTVFDMKRLRIFELHASSSAIAVSYVGSRAHAIAIAGDGTMAVSSVRSPILEDEWPGFRVGPDTLDLVPVPATPTIGSWIALEQDGAGSAEAFLVTGAKDATQSAFGRTGAVTTVELDRPVDTLFDRRLATVLLESSRLTLDVATVDSPSPVTGSLLHLAGVLDGIADGMPIAVTGKPSSVPIARLGGIRRFDGSTWTTLALASRGAAKVAACDGGALYAISGIGSVVRLTTGAAPSDPVALEGLGAERATALAALDGSPLVGTEHGTVLRLDTDGVTLKPTPTPASSAIVAFAESTTGALFAGTKSHGLLRSKDRGDTWERIGTEMPGEFAAVATGPSGMIVAGGPDGVVVSTDDGDSWTARNVGLRDTQVLSVAVTASGTMLAGTLDGGVFIRTIAAAAWRRWSDGLPACPVRSVVLDPTGPRVYATCAGGGVSVATLGGAGWQLLPPTVSNQVDDLVVGSDGYVIVATAASTALAGTDDRVAFLVRTARVGTIAPGLADTLDLGRMSASVRDALGVAGAPVSAAATVTVASTGSAWIVVDDGLAMSIERGLSGLDVFANDNALDVVSGPVATAAGVRWTLSNRLGATGTLDAAVGEVTPGPASSAVDATSEIATVARSTPIVDCGMTTLNLASPLLSTYDPATVSVCLNVVAATHGETVASEVLGSGDMRKSFQQFTLKRPPMTWLPDPKEPGGVRNTLHVSISSDPQGALTGAIGSSDLAPPPVNEVHWTEAASLAAAGPTDRVFTVRNETHDRTVLMFGDGIHGARLPKGTENVRARYRSGLGTVGNVPAKALSHVPVRPLGIRRVVNPVAATGGVDPESWNHARVRAPLSLRTFGGVVSVDDYADFAQQFPGIGKAAVSVVWNGRHRVIVVSVLGPDGAVFAPADPLLTTLTEAIRGERSSPRPFHVVPAELRRFRLAARLDVTHARDEAHTAKRAIKHLAKAFAFDRRSLAESVESTAIVSLLQAVRDVASVVLTAFHLEDDSPHVAERVVAHRARWDQALDKFRGAEWLQPDLPNGVAFAVSKVQ